MSLGDRMAGDYEPPVLVEPKGGPVPKWTETKKPKPAGEEKGGGNGAVAR